MIKISRIETFKLNLPFRLSFAHSKATRDFSENLIVRVTLDNGVVGYGEGIPRDYVTGESFESAEFAVRALYAPALTGTRIATVEGVLSVLKQKFDFFGLREEAKGASWCAIELAVLDALSRCLRVPLLRLFGGSARQKLRYGSVVPICSSNTCLKILSFYRLFGFETVKIKVGGNLQEDVDRVRLARRVMGPRTRLRVDANCAWNVSTAIAAMAAFRPFNVLSVEQPVPADDIDGMSEVTNSIAEDVIADESICTIEQARALARRHACTGFNIRLSKNGGWIASQEIADIARTYGIALHLGAQIGESGILSAAGRAFGCLEGPFANCEGSNNLFLLKRDIVRENLNVGWGGIGSTLAHPGLGVTVNKAMLRPSATLVPDPDIISRFYDSRPQHRLYH